MTVHRLEEEMLISELYEWVTHFQMEAEEHEKMKREMDRKGKSSRGGVRPARRR